MPHKDADAEPREGNTPFTPRPLRRRRIDRERNSEEIREYFSERRKRLKIVTTTKTPHGQEIDWIARDSQSGMRSGMRPPRSYRPPRETRKDLRQRETFARSGLEIDGVERGPAGTVPIVRRDVELGGRYDLKRFLSKTHGHRVMNDRGQPVARPEPDGNHRYASSSRDITAFGAEGIFSCFDPWLESEGDFSLIQLGLTNSDLGYLQSAEAGWQECNDIYGDWVPHLFTYYTTNGYTDDDDNVGGYNADVDGWVQYDDTICPGITFVPYSVSGGTQYRLSLKYQWYEGNWWLSCQDRWIGFYPASLYMGNQSVFSTLGDHADWVGFWGEIFDSDDVAGRTKTDMTSGAWPASGWQSSGYVHNMRYQTDRAGTTDEFDGSPGIWESDPDMYGIEAHFGSRSSWGSYVYLGGPGAG